MIRIQRFLVALTGLVAFCIPPVNAQNEPDEPVKIYDVEVIIFKNAKVPRSHEINLPVAAPGASTNSLRLAQIQNASNASQKAGFTALEEEALQLLAQVKEIDKSGRYDLLLHAGWRQPGLGEDDSIAVFIRAGKIFPSTYSSIDQFRDLEDTEIKDPDSQSTRINNLSLQSGGISHGRGLHELEGLITISLSRYLHTNAQLILRKPASAIEALEQAATDEKIAEVEGGILLNHMLNEKRRMRSRKLHYLDHPQFGMLVLITPYQLPEIETPSEEDSAQTVETPGAETSDSG